MAAEQGAAEVCEVLLEPQYGADIGALTSTGQTALHLAVQRLHLLTAQLLVAAGALVNVQNAEGNTPLHLAVLRDSATTVCWLCSQRADLSLRNNKAQSPLDFAVSAPVRELMQACLRCEPLPEVRPEPLESPADLMPLCVLGKSKFVQVFLARRLSTGRDYAVKVVHKRHIEELESFLQTERRLLSLLRLPFVVGLHAAFQTDETVVLVTDFLPGGDLGQLLSREKTLPEDQVRKYCSELVVTLEDLHRLSILHCNLNASNVLLDRSGHAVLVDFGLAKEDVGVNQATWSFCGAPAYLPPEVLLKAGHSVAADWYQLGVLLCELLTGKPPFFSHSREHLFGKILQSRLNLSTSLSLEARDLLMQLLNRNPERRLRDPNQIKQHPFFRDIDWERVRRRELEVPRLRVQRPHTQSLSRDNIYGGAGSYVQLPGWPSCKYQS
jgi:hypothetical protein